jgi:prolyl-tRNA editing enzyme YbaK/EbsC (Cys-tRNA(Pro) deacylase)
VAKGVSRFLEATKGFGLEIVEHNTSTHTAQEAADAVGAPVGAIVKSLLFIANGEPLLVLASGENRVEVSIVEQELGVSLQKADADAVKTLTGYSIGGVPPFGHPTALTTAMDKDLMLFPEVWAAAGGINHVFALTPLRLQELAGAHMIAVC